MHLVNDLFSSLSFTRGRPMANRFMLAPMTNRQSHADGTLSDQEIHWLSLRAQGGFARVLTAAAYVQKQGQGYSGQLGIHEDSCIAGLTRLAQSLRERGSLSAVQLYHGGVRSDPAVSGMDVVGPSTDETFGARAMSVGEIEAMIEAFVAGAIRAERAGFYGAELHGAHTYLLCSFLSGEMNRRTDDYGGSLENRARALRQIISGIRARCQPGFQLGLRLSAELMGLKLGEMRILTRELMLEGQLDYIDFSLLDAFKQPAEEEYHGRPLIGWVTDIERGNTRLGVTGKIDSGAMADACLAAGADFVLIGRAAILDYDFPNRVRQDRGFRMPDLPIPLARLEGQGLSPSFLDYLQTFPGFLETGAPAAARL